MPESDRPVQSTSRRPPPEPEPVELVIVYQDEWLIVIDKPPGMVVHPTYKNWSGTLLNGVLWHLRNATGPNGPGLHDPAPKGSSLLSPGVHVEPRIVTRLDKDTSGLVLVALTSDIHARIQRDTAGRHVRKEYLAVVHGTPTPPCGSIRLPLARSIVDRRRVVVDPSGQESETRYQVLSSGAPRDLSLVRCELVTGRTHQIRVHLMARGWPVVGDRVYGKPDEVVPRQALHAWRVTLPHPISRQTLELEAPLPADLRGLSLGPVSPR